MADVGSMGKIKTVTLIGVSVGVSMQVSFCSVLANENITFEKVEETIVANENANCCRGGCDGGGSASLAYCYKFQFSLWYYICHFKLGCEMCFLL